MSNIRIAAVGDSLVQGFMSGAILRTDVSFPAMIAESLGLTVDDEFRIPTFPFPGLPLNLEEFPEECTDQMGEDIGGYLDFLVRFPSIYSEFVDRVEELYERGDGSLPVPANGVYHNLAVWGFRVYDCLEVTPNLCQRAIEEEEGWIQDDFAATASAAMYRTASRVLNPEQTTERNETTQLESLQELIETEGLDVVILSLGANDCLNTVLSLHVRDMEGADEITDDPYDRTKEFNLTSVAQFQQDYDELCRRLADTISGIAEADRPRVFVGNVPHVTIPPVTRGIGEFREKYFDYYGRFFATEDGFNPCPPDSRRSKDNRRSDRCIQRNH